MRVCVCVQRIYIYIDYGVCQREELGQQYEVRIGMQYSSPTVEESLRDLAESGVDNVGRGPKLPKRQEAADLSILLWGAKRERNTGCHIFCHSLIPRFGSVSKRFFRMPASAFCFEACLSLAPKLPRRLRQPQGRYHHGYYTDVLGFFCFQALDRLFWHRFGTRSRNQVAAKAPSCTCRAYREVACFKPPPKPSTHCVCVRADGQAASDISQAQPSAMYVKPSTSRIFQPWEPEHS